jgi:hypothetical protein
MATTWESRYWTRGAMGGVAAGLIAGAWLSIIMLLVNIAKNQDVWVGMKMAAMPFLGERATQPGFDLGPVALGLLSHFAVSAIWGLLFGVLFYGLSKGATVAVGALWGVVVWIGMYYVVLPVVGLASLARSVPIGMAVANHVLFGVLVGLAFLPFQITKRGDQFRGMRGQPVTR